MLAFLSSLASKSIAIGLAITAGALVVVNNRRLLLLALLVQYLLVGLLMARLISPQVALVEVAIGLLVCLILFLTIHQLSGRGGSSERVAEASPAPLRSVFLSLAVILVGLAVPSLAGRYPLPEVPLEICLACYWLCSMGFLAASLTERPLKAGSGLLTSLLGFELFYITLESSLSVLALLGAIDCLVGLLIAYLALARGEET